MRDERVGRTPGDIILDRYLPNATPEEREIARENLRAILAMYLRIEEERALRTSGKHESPKMDAGVRVQSGSLDPPL